MLAHDDRERPWICLRNKEKISHHSRERISPLNAFNALVSESHNQDEIRSELQNMTVFTDSMFKSLWNGRTLSKTQRKYVP